MNEVKAIKQNGLQSINWLLNDSVLNKEIYFNFSHIYLGIIYYSGFQCSL